MSTVSIIQWVQRKQLKVKWEKTGVYEQYKWEEDKKSTACNEGCHLTVRNGSPFCHNHSPNVNSRHHVKFNRQLLYAILP